MLFQQNQRIEVIVTKQDSGSQETGNESKNTDDVGSVDSNKKTPKKGQFSSTWWRTQITHTLATTRQILNLGLNYHLTGVGYKYGDQAYQDMVQREVEIVNDIGSVVASAGMGALYGARGGPVGALIGAGLSVAGTGASLATKYANREREQSVKEFKQNNEISYARARAGINFTNGRLR